MNSVTQHRSATTVRGSLAASSSSRGLHSPGVPRARQSGARSSPRMLASTAASRSGSRKLRRQSGSSFVLPSYSSTTASRSVSVSSVKESSSNGIPLTMIVLMVVGWMTLLSLNQPCQGIPLPATDNI